jgi:hypothetical protein
VDLDPNTEKVAREIMRYFLRHPVAADSLEGIARWRLMLQKIDQTVEETAEALHALVDADLMEEVQGPSGEPVYRLNASKREEAERLLKGEGDRAE